MQQPTLTRTTKLKKNVPRTGIQICSLVEANVSQVVVRLQWQLHSQVLGRVGLRAARVCAVGATVVDALLNGPNTSPILATKRWRTKAIAG